MKKYNIIGFILFAICLIISFALTSVNFYSFEDLIAVFGGFILCFILINIRFYVLGYCIGIASTVGMLFHYFANVEQGSMAFAIGLEASIRIILFGVIFEILRGVIKLIKKLLKRGKLL